MNEILKQEEDLLLLLYEVGKLTRITREEILKELPKITKEVFNYVTDSLHQRGLIYIPARIESYEEDVGADLDPKKCSRRKDVFDGEMPMGEPGDQELKEWGYGITPSGIHYAESHYFAKLQVAQIRKKRDKVLIFEDSNFRVHAEEGTKCVFINKIELIDTQKEVKIRDKLKRLLAFFLERRGSGIKKEKVPQEFRGRLAKDIWELNEKFEKVLREKQNKIGKEEKKLIKSLLEHQEKIESKVILYDPYTKTFQINEFRLVKTKHKRWVKAG